MYFAPMSHRESVAIYWDYENCKPPSQLLGYDIANNIRRIAHAFGSVTVFRAYLEVSEQSPKSCNLRSELQTSGVSLIDCPHSGRKDVVDKMILVDMLAYAIDHSPPATIMLISGDRDYAYAVSILRLRQYKVVLVVPPAVHTSLKSQASVVFDWIHDILGKQTPAKLPSSIKQLEPLVDDDIVGYPLERVGERGPILLSPSSPLALVGECRPVSARDSCESQPSGHAKHSKSTDSTLKPISHSVCREPPDTIVRSRSSTTVLQESPIPSQTTSSNQVHNDDRISPPTLDVAKPQTPPYSGHTIRDSSMDSPVARSNQSLRPSAKSFAPILKPGNTLITEKERQAESLSKAILDGRHSSLIATHNAASTTGIHSPKAIAGREHLGLKDDHSSISSDIVNTPKDFEFVVEAGLTKDTRETTAGKEDVSVLAQLHAPVTSQLHKGLQWYSWPEAMMFDDVVASATIAPYPAESSCGTPEANIAHVHHTSSVFSARPIAPPLHKDLEKQRHAESRASVIALAPVASSTYTSSSGVACSPTDTVVDDPQTQSVTPKPVPPQFQLLVELLLQERARGVHQPLRSNIALSLVAKDRAIYKRAGVAKFRELTALAESARIIQLGGWQGTAWISLHPDWL